MSEFNLKVKIKEEDFLFFHSWCSFTCSGAVYKKDYTKDIIITGIKLKFLNCYPISFNLEDYSIIISYDYFLNLSISELRDYKLNQILK